MNSQSRNMLAGSKSAYLRQHKNNPVHWRLWGEPALKEAQKAQKPILLSIGYAACHWCHVMARESFEDDAIAQIINQHFIPIKIDREERPDIDSIYMNALQDLGQQGGWPLTMFLDPFAKPIWGGTYFPNPPRNQALGFGDILLAIAKLWREQGDELVKNRAFLQDALEKRQNRQRQGDMDMECEPIAHYMARFFDEKKGGMMGAPKFPNVPMLDFLWRIGTREKNESLKQITISSLNALCLGGIYDHIGGGFARYTVDEKWHIPHFEKMLYDNALLIWLLSEVFRDTQSALFAQAVSQTIAWMKRELFCDGALASALDADSLDENQKSREGAFYVWSDDEITSLLGKDSAPFKQAFGVTQDGNWEGVNILDRLPSQLQAQPKQNLRDGGAGDIFDPFTIFDPFARQKDILFQARQKRKPPQRDGKIIAFWNGLAIIGLTHASWVFAKAEWLALAKEIFSFIHKKLIDNQRGSRLAHSFCDGQLITPAIADDYAAMIYASLTLYQASGEADYLSIAEEWAADLIKYYRSPQGGFYMSASDVGDVPMRECAAMDGPCPSANSLAWRAFSFLYALTQKPIYQKTSQELAFGFGADAKRNPLAHAGWLSALHLSRNISQIILIEDEPFFEKAFKGHIPSRPDCDENQNEQFFTKISYCLWQKSDRQPTHCLYLSWKYLLASLHR